MNLHNLQSFFSKLKLRILYGQKVNGLVFKNRFIGLKNNHLDRLDNFEGNRVIFLGKGNHIHAEGKCYHCRFRFKGSNNQVIIEQGCHLRGVHIQFHGDNQYIKIGKGTFIWEGTKLISDGEGNYIEIGEYCGFSDHVNIWNSDTHQILDEQNHVINPSRPVEIGNRVWLGHGSAVLKGSRIGDDSMIGFNSVVMQSIPANSIAAGYPAKVLRNGTHWSKDPIKEVILFRKSDVAASTDSIRSDAGGQTLSQDLNPDIHMQVGNVLRANYPSLPLDGKYLVDDHHIDSMTQMSIVATLSEHFGVNISFEHVTPANFNSLEAMTLLIQRLKNETTQTVAKTKNGIKISIEDNAVMNLEPSMAEKPVVQLILEQAKATPDALALVLEGTEVTYRRMGAAIYASFRKLRELGVSEGDYVCLHGLCSEYYLAAFYATQLTGAVAVPLEKAVGVERVHEIAEDVSAKLIVAGSDLKKELEQAGTAFNVVSLDDFASLSLDDAIPYESIHYPEMSSPCHVLYTTGSTGKSKGVVVSHKTFSWAAYSCIKKNRTRQRTVSVTAFPLNHLAGLYCVSRNMTVGLTTLVFDGVKDIQRFFELFDKYQVNYIGLAPSLLKMLVQVGKQKLMQVSERVYGIACGSEPLPLATMKEYGEVFPNAQMQNIFGSSELGYVCAADCNSEMGEVPVGTPMEGVTIGLKDEDGKIHTENDFMGLICVKTPMLMEGYFNMPELTASVIQDGWFVMSDMGYKDKDGVLYHRGRADDVIIVAGFKVSPLEVEGEALNSGLVSECVCTSSKDRNGVVSLRLIVVPLDPARYDEGELRKYLTAHMEAYRVPKTIETTDALKRTFNGKLDRKAYRE